MRDRELLSIGPVAAEVGLSIRTIRYYEEVGLIEPSGRTVGGFRLYNAADVARLLLVKRMKPLGYPLEEMARLLRLIDAMVGATDGEPADAVAAPEQAAVAEARAQLEAFAESVAERVVGLRTQLRYAEEFRDRIVAALERPAAVGLSPAQASTK